MTTSNKISGAGLGYRRELREEFWQNPPALDFVEIAPENWIGMGGKRLQELQAIFEHYPVVCHGLSLSIGGPDPLDYQLLSNIKKFFDQYPVKIYTEHLSYCTDGAHLYDLLPIPFTEEAVHYVAGRVKQIQDYLERTIALENVSYYNPLAQDISELEFINGVINESGCDLLLDVNNIYVNSRNHGYDALEFLNNIQAKNVAYIHTAGHLEEEPDLIIDTHGADVIQPVWELLTQAYKRFGPLPTLLERDFNFPDLTTLLTEVATIRQLQHEAQTNND